MDLLLRLWNLPAGYCIQYDRDAMVKIARMDLRSAFDTVRPEDIAALVTKLREGHGLTVTERESRGAFEICRPEKAP